MPQAFQPNLYTAAYFSPVGYIVVRANDHFVQSISIADNFHESISSNHITVEAMIQLSAWFEGDFRNFSLPLEPAKTPRGNDLRTALREIPYGTVASYGEIARAAASSPRAVGQACRHNPFPIVVPCHRVTSAGGMIGNYSAGKGIATKSWLIRHERRKN